MGGCDVTYILGSMGERCMCKWMWVKDHAWEVQMWVNVRYIFLGSKCERCKCRLNVNTCIICIGGRFCIVYTTSCVVFGLLEKIKNKMGTEFLRYISHLASEFCIVSYAVWNLLYHFGNEYCCFLPVVISFLSLFYRLV